MKKKIIFVGLLVVLIGLLGSRTPRFPWKPGVQNLKLAIGNSSIVVEVADTEAERARGLSGRPMLAENTGILFVFDRADYHTFWMKEMRFPIDIIWLDDNWRVIDLAENISPPRLSSTTLGTRRSGQAPDFLKTYQPRAPARYVLEVNAGFIASRHLTLMSRVTLDIGTSRIKPINYSPF